MGNSTLKPDGWHSRRHETDEAQAKARERFANRRLERPRQRWDAIRRQWVKYEPQYGDRHTDSRRVA